MYRKEDNSGPKNKKGDNSKERLNFTHNFAFTNT